VDAGLPQLLLDRALRLDFILRQTGKDPAVHLESEIGVAASSFWDCRPALQ